MDKFSAMRTFVRVVDAGTFTKAAQSLGVPKSQVTRLVQSLEQELKTLLLNRTTRRIVPTDDGIAYYQQAVRILDEIEELESSMARVKASPRGQLRIDVSPAIANLILVPSLGDFCAKYPDIQIDIGVGERPVDLVGESVDCAIRSGIVSECLPRTGRTGHRQNQHVPRGPSYRCRAAESRAAGVERWRLPDLRGVSTRSPSQREAACLHRLGGGRLRKRAQCGGA